MSLLLPIYKVNSWLIKKVLILFVTGYQSRLYEPATLILKFKHYLYIIGSFVRNKKSYHENVK